MSKVEVMIMIMMMTMMMMMSFQVLFFPSVVVSVVFLLNLIAEYYDTTNALHLSTIFKMFAIWLFVSFPLTVVGTMFGRHWAGKSNFPCRVNAMARPIPQGPW
jgi:transmembrane 9 superfamily member 3